MKQIIDTKHFYVSQKLGERVQYMVPGEPLPTLAELMREFDASQATITQALGRLRSQGLISKPFGKKKLVVSQQPEKSLFRIVLIRPTWPSPDYDPILNAIQEEGTHQHLSFNVYSYLSLESLDIEKALFEKDAAFLITTAEAIPPTLKKAIESSPKPVIFLREKPDHVDAPEVILDDYESGRMAVKHLLELGHRNILAITSEPAGIGTIRRVNGWKDMMKEAGIPHYEQLLADCSVRPGQYAVTGSYDNLRYWLQANREVKFTAAFCITWTGALAAMRCFREQNLRLPDDMSIVTCGGESSYCEFLDPALTTLEIDFRQFAHEAITLVENILLRPKLTPRKAVQVKAFLVPRASSRQLKKVVSHSGK